MHFVSEDVLVHLYISFSSSFISLSSSSSSSSMALHFNANHHLFNGLLTVRSVL
jgi:hypothetical protein